MTELLGREAQAFVARQSRRQPFLLYLAFGAPHYSMMAPKRYLDRFPAGMERDRRMHLAMVAAVDDVIGALLHQLRQLGIERDTVVYFQADNGATNEVRASSYGKPYVAGSNGRYRGYKQGLFDGGIHVPAILRAPGLVQPGKVWDRPMMSMDLLPTLLEIAGRQPAHGDRWAEYSAGPARRESAARIPVLELQQSASGAQRRLEVDSESAEFSGR